MPTSTKISIGDFMTYVLVRHMPDETTILTSDIAVWQAAVREAQQAFRNVFPVLDEFTFSAPAEGCSPRSEQVGALLEVFLRSNILVQGDGGHVYRIMPEMKATLIANSSIDPGQLGNSAGFELLARHFADKLCVPEPAAFTS